MLFNAENMLSVNSSVFAIIQDAGKSKAITLICL